MVVLKSSGGAGGRFKFTWRGATVTRQVDAAIQQALDERSKAALGLLHSELHRVTGEMADKAFAEVAVAGTKRTLRIGSDAPHTIYHELGTATFSGHPQIRSIVDRIAPTITPAIKAAMGRVK